MSSLLELTSGQTCEGGLTKMQTTLSSPVEYRLSLGGDLINMNHLINRKIHLKWLGSIHCLHCNKQTKKSFGQGYCYNCFRTLAACDQCIMSPEKCHFHAGTCREPEWGQTHCMRPHFVYLANASGLKVGITRDTQVPTRWIDQGAVQAMPICSVSSRRLSGLIEVIFKNQVSDRTNWRAMLKGNPDPIDMQLEKARLLDLLNSEVRQVQDEEGEGEIRWLDEPPISIQYPVDVWPTKVSSHNFDKNPDVIGRLQGIKGQYLLLDSGVINIRKFTSYQVQLTAVD